MSGEMDEKKNLILFGDQLYLLPEGMVAYDRLRLLRPGLHLGNLKKNRFEPSHALAMALKAEEVTLSRNCTAASQQTAAYLRGEALPDAEFFDEADGAGERESARDKGWALMTVDGYSMGWAKLSGGQLKNHYPKGLRR